MKDDLQQNKKLDSTIMNFLYAGETYKSAEHWLNKTDDHANLFGGSFKVLSKILDDSREVIVRINAGLARDVDKLAAQARFELVASAPIKQKDFSHPFEIASFSDTRVGPDHGCIPVTLQLTVKDSF
ncbi:hypothetical protein Tco_1339536 [Tanacetum coccineum]